MLYGSFPISSHVVLKVGNITADALDEVSTQRQMLPPSYNHYERISSHSSNGSQFTDLKILFQPLFGTSFFLDDYLSEEKNLLNSQRIIITSASSKTALGLAFLLSVRKLDQEIIGLTSSSNVTFSEASGYYDRVLSYDHVGILSSIMSTFVADFAGNEAVLSALESTLNLSSICRIGASHGQIPSNSHKTETSFFFVPNHVRKRRDEWGEVTLNRKLLEAMILFLESTECWLQLKRVNGMSDFEELYLKMLNGYVNPDEGNIVYLLY